MQIEGYEIPNDIIDPEITRRSESAEDLSNYTNAPIARREKAPTKTNYNSFNANLEDSKRLIKEGNASIALSKLKGLNET